jgi:hypothetical protein
MFMGQESIWGHYIGGTTWSPQYGPCKTVTGRSMVWEEARDALAVLDFGTVYALKTNATLDPPMKPFEICSLNLAQMEPKLNAPNT